MRLAVLLIATCAPCACRGVSDLEDDEACKNVGYAMASRMLDCTSDLERANALFEHFDDELRCVAAQGGEADFVCAVSINSATCAEVADYGDSVDAWVFREGECANILARADGSELPRPLAGGANIQDNEVCARVAVAAELRHRICNPGSLSSSNDLDAIKASAPTEVNGSYSCLVRWPDGLAVPSADADACVAELEAVDCSIARDATAAEIVAVAASCAPLVEAR